MRILAWSDLHIDYRENLQRLLDLPAFEHRRDVLLLAGDLTDDLALLGQALASVQRKFAAVLLVPGNHELWVRRRECADSREKLALLEALCRLHGVHTAPAVIGGVRIVPLLSWYARPEDSADSLFVVKPTEVEGRTAWVDDAWVRWPGECMHQELLARNTSALTPHDGPVVSISHFLPRRELLTRTAAERASQGPGPVDRHPEFNFSRVAGSAAIDAQVRALGTSVHVYGHQHRNRDRVIDGVRYVSHCLGYPGEDGCGSGASAAGAPLVVWEG